MARPRHLARLAAARVVFQMDQRPEAWRAQLDYQLEEAHLSASASEFAEELVAGVADHLEEIDRRLTEASTNWALAQIGGIERSVLRLAAEEVLFRRRDPVAVAIDEAVRLAKELGGPDSARFVNGVLGRLARDAAPSGART